MDHIYNINALKDDYVNPKMDGNLSWRSIDSHMVLMTFFLCHDVFQRTGKSSRRNQMPLAPQITLESFNKWFVDFVGPISPLEKKTAMRYIITVKEYLTKRDEVTPVRDCTVVTATKFFF